VKFKPLGEKTKKLLKGDKKEWIRKEEWGKGGRWGRTIRGEQRGGGYNGGGGGGRGARAGCRRGRWG